MLVTATALKMNPDNMKECHCNNPTGQPVLPTHGPCPLFYLQSVTNDLCSEAAWDPFLPAKRAGGEFSHSRGEATPTEASQVPAPEAEPVQSMATMKSQD